MDIDRYIYIYIYILVLSFNDRRECGSEVILGNGKTEDLGVVVLIL